MSNLARLCCGFNLHESTELIPQHINKWLNYAFYRQRLGAFFYQIFRKSRQVLYVVLLLCPEKNTTSGKCDFGVCVQ